MFLFVCLFVFVLFFTPHAQHERGKVIGDVCFGAKNIFESYFSDRLTFSKFAVGLLIKFID